MILPLKLLTVINNDENPTISTFYFFCKDLKILLPVTVTENDKIRFTNFEKANIYNTYLRTLKALNAKIYGISIYLYRNNDFYTYLHLRTKSGRYEINCNISDTLGIYLHTKCPIFTTSKVLENGGIKVTKKLVASALGY